jgi:dipeptidyl aminopeptidase/acylaminoacyl peptidase
LDRGEVGRADGGGSIAIRRAGKDATKETVMTIRRLVTAAVTALGALVLVVVLALGACGGPDETAAPAPPTPEACVPAVAGPGTIAFTKYSGEDSYDICSVREDGTAFRSLAVSLNDEQRAAWSPDGRRIAYARGSGLWVMNADGSQQHLVAHHDDWLNGIAWSPDGARIAAAACDSRPVWPWSKAGDAGLIVVNADGTGLSDVTTATAGRSDSGPVWAPDGRIFFLRESRGSAAICSIDPDDGGVSPVTAVAVPSSFSLSPDGNWLAVWDGESDSLLRLSANGPGTAVVLVAGVSSYVDGRIALSWSPDVGKIAFAADAGAGPWTEPSALYILDCGSGDGDRERKVLTAAGWPAPRAVPNIGKGFNPSWQPL